MDKVRLEKDSVILAFNEKFYPRRFIEQAMQDYKEVCSFSESKKGLVLVPREKKHLPIIGYEFYNYVLGLIKNQWQ